MTREKELISKSYMEMMLVCLIIFHCLNFCRVSKELYAPALGGIMLSIGIKLSFDDFALAFKQ